MLPPANNHGRPDSIGGPRQGWKYIHSSRRWHFFVEKVSDRDDMRSLCGKWGVPLLGSLEDGGPMVDSCVICSRKKQAIEGTDNETSNEAEPHAGGKT